MGNAIYLQAAGVNESGFSFRFGLYCELFFNICGDYTQGNKRQQAFDGTFVSLWVLQFSEKASVLHDLSKEIGGKLHMQCKQ